MIKLEQAIRQMNPGDKFSAENITMDEEGILRFPSGVYMSMCQSNLDLEGEIIRAEPEVLTTDKAWDKFNKEYTAQSMEGCYKDGFEDGIDTGQIKEWKRLKPLIDAAIKVQEKIGRMRDGAFPDNLYSDLYSQLKNITPPWETE